MGKHKNSSEPAQPKLLVATGTELALGEADQWLATQRASTRAIIVVTDGLPDDEEATAAQCRTLRRRGVTLLVGSIDVGLELCAESMPGSVVFNCDPDHAASSLQVAIRRIMG